MELQASTSWGIYTSKAQVLADEESITASVLRTILWTPPPGTKTDVAATVTVSSCRSSCLRHYPSSSYLLGDMNYPFPIRFSDERSRLIDTPISIAKHHYASCICGHPKLSWLTTTVGRSEPQPEDWSKPILDADGAT